MSVRRLQKLLDMRLENYSLFPHYGIHQSLEIQIQGNRRWLKNIGNTEDSIPFHDNPG